MGQLSDNTILITRGTLVDPSSDLNRQTVDILIEKGVVTQISKKPIRSNSETVFDAKGSYVLPGMCDLRCQLKDPGYEHQRRHSVGCCCSCSQWLYIFGHTTRHRPCDSKQITDRIYQANR